jgi:hypothetical protein
LIAIAFNKPPFTEKKTDCLGESGLAYFFLETYGRNIFSLYLKKDGNGNDAFNMPPKHGMK